MSLLKGLRVAEFSDGLVDLGGRMMSELGAQVVSYSTGYVRPDNETIAWEHGKGRVELGRLSVAEVRSLLDGVDILLDGRRRATLAELDAAAAQHDQLIHVVARSFSPSGPYADRPASDITLMALSGLMAVVGERERPPLKLPGEQAYALTGIQSVCAALMGLYARRRTGRGQRIDLSALQATALANYREPIMYEWTGRIGTRTGNRLVRGKSGVRQVWPCLDGFVTWSMIDNPSMMRSVVGVLAEHAAAGELLDIDWDATLVADEDQGTIERWESVFGAFFDKHTKQRLGSWSLEHGWGLSAIGDLDEVRESAHLSARSLFVEVEDAKSGRRAMLPGPLFGHGAPAVAPPRRLEMVARHSEVLEDSAP